MNTALEYSTRVVQEGGRRCKKSTLNDLVYLTPLRIPLMNPPNVRQKVAVAILCVFCGCSTVMGKIGLRIENGSCTAAELKDRDGIPLLLESKKLF